jgi:hypothetical protein
MKPYARAIDDRLTRQIVKRFGYGWTSGRKILTLYDRLGIDANLTAVESLEHTKCGNRRARRHLVTEIDFDNGLKVPDSGMPRRHLPKFLYQLLDA